MKSLDPIDKQMTAEITCKCSRCKFSLNYTTPSLSLLCACEDCRQALAWGFEQGGIVPTDLPQLFYIRSDIRTIDGLEFMQPFQLRDNAKSTRVYCTKCFSILGVDHPGYRDNVFMFFKGFCCTNFDLSIKPSAVIYLKDCLRDKNYTIPDHIEKIWSFTSEERIRFHSIPEVSNSLTEVTRPAEGMTFREIIQKMPEIKVLNLAPN